MYGSVHFCATAKSVIKKHNNPKDIGLISNNEAHLIILNSADTKDFGKIMVFQIGSSHHVLLGEFHNNINNNGLGMDSTTSSCPGVKIITMCVEYVAGLLDLFNVL